MYLFKINIIIMMFLSMTSLYGDFSKRYYNNLIGNIQVIGNTLLDGSDDGTSNAGLSLTYVDVDSNSSTFNSSSATIDSIINGVNVNKSKIKWAGLYWLGYLHSDEADTGIDSVFDFSGDTLTQIDQNINTVIDNHSVYLNIDNLNSYKITPEETIKYRYYYWQWYTTKYVSYIYRGFKDVTDILKDKNINHKYTVSNVPTRSGETHSGSAGDGLGDFSAWSLVIVYENSDEPMEKTRNVTVFDGFEIVKANDPTTINFSGFKTPKYAPDGVDSTISIFAAEGDKYILGDKAVLTNEDGYQYQLPNTIGTDSYFASSIEGVDNRDPNIANNNGIDIHINQIGTKGGSDKPISINQSTAKLTLSSTQDLYIPTMVAFSTDLYSPQLCYDYSIKLGDYMNIDSIDRNFTVDNYTNEPLELKILIKSKEADFDLVESKLRASFTPDNVFSFKQGSARTSYPNTTNYYDATETSRLGEIAIGSDTTAEGGTISADEIFYSKLYYNFNKQTFNGRFDIFLDAKISFDGVTKVPYSLSTQAPKGSTSYIGRCPTNSIYDPSYGIFNIEGGNSDFTQTDAVKYSLKTQIVGVPYSVSVASYQKDLNGNYTEKLNRNATVELELIDGGTFDNNSSAGFDSVCQDPDTYSAGTFVHFNNNARVKVDIPQDYPAYPSNLALKNAIFRVWALVKQVNNNKVLVEHNCQNQSDYNCFRTVYNNNYFYTEYAKNKYPCYIKCSSYYTDNSCYKCLRENYAAPICSRDNFSIRPDSYSIDIFDNKENNDSITSRVDIGKNINTTPYNIAAGYVYPLEINATIYGSREHVDGYIFSNNRFKDSSATAKFTGSNSCLDKSNKNLNISLTNGTTTVYENNSTSQPKNGIFLNNSGAYKIDIIDNSWTLVDQIGYKNKPFPDVSDCEANSTVSNYTDLNGKRGCTIKNGINASYPSLNLTSHPYKFYLNSIDVKSHPNLNASYLYVNDLRNSPTKLSTGGAMSIKVGGSIVAKGEDNSSLTNYTDGCMANDLDIKIKYTNDQNDTNKNISLMYSTFGESVKLQKDKALIEDNISSSRFNMTPAASYLNYINFERDYDKPLNPFKLTIDEFNVTSPNETITVNMVKSYIPKGNKELNITKTLYYAKAVSKSDFYDDIYKDSVDTPIVIEIFCDKSLSYCRKYGIDTTKDFTNEYNWWISREHNASFGDGIVKLEVNSLNNADTKVEVKPTTADKFIEAIDKNIKVSKKLNAAINYPYIVFIDPTDAMKSDYSYLLYNKYKNQAPTHLYKVRFVDTSAAWSGSGKTGFTTDFNSTGRKNNKVEW